MTEAVVPERAPEDTDEVWGETGEEDADEHLERERPPHHEG